MAQNDKKALLCLLSQGPYIIWSSFMVHMWKKIISLCFFLHFAEVLFFGVSSGLKEQKMVQNDKKLSVVLHISDSIHHMIMIFGTQKWWHLQMLFSFFQNVDFLGCSGAKRAKNDQLIVSSRVYICIYIVYI